MATFEAYAWGPDSTGELIAEFDNLCHIAEIVELAKGLNASLQITKEDWEGGYVTTWDGNNAVASCKRFAGCNEFGWGGNVPYEAEALALAIEETALSKEREEDAAEW